MKGTPWPLIIFLGLIAVSGYIGMYMMLKSPAEMAQAEGVTLIHVPREDQKANSSVLVSVAAISSASDAGLFRLDLFYREGKGRKPFQRLPMTKLEGSNRYVQLLPGQDKGKKSYYFFQARLADGKEVTLPQGASSKRNLFPVRWVEDSSRWLLYSHILFMLGAFLTLMHAFYYALYHLMTGQRHPALYSAVLWGTALFFVAGFPLGWAVAYQAFGQAWTGIPFGKDITDNKTLITFLYWLAIMIFYQGNPLAGKRVEGFLLGHKAFSLLVLIGAALTVVVFLIPHSI